MLSNVASVAALSAVAHAGLVPRGHPEGGVMTMDFPPSRGWLGAQEMREAPCGAVSDTNVNPFPMSMGDISMTMVRDINDLTFSYAPTSDADDQSAYQELLPDSLYLYPGKLCNNAPDFSELGFSEGDRVTIQATGKSGGDLDTFYVCADIELVSYHDFASDAPDYECLNEVTSLKVHGPADQSGTWEGDKTSSGYSFSPVGAGFIGAGVTIGVFALLGLALFFLFGLRLNRKNKTAAAASPAAGAAAAAHHHDDDQSSMNSMRKA